MYTVFIQPAMSKHINSCLIGSDPDDSESRTGQNLRRTFHGVMYQIIVCILCIIRTAKKSYYSFKIYLEKENCGNFDDVVVEYQAKKDEIIKVRHIQTKHKSDENSKITTNSILSISDGEKLGIRKYLESFVKIRDDNKKNYIRELEDFIICTNNDFDNFGRILRADGYDETGRVRKLKRNTAGNAINYGELFIEEFSLDEDDILYTKGCKCYRYVNDKDSIFYKTNLKTIENFLGVEKSFKVGPTEIDELARKVVKCVFIRPKKDQPKLEFRLNSKEISKNNRNFLLNCVIEPSNNDKNNNIGILQENFKNNVNINQEIFAFRNILIERLLKKYSYKSKENLFLTDFKFSVDKSFYEGIKKSKSSESQNPYTKENVIDFFKTFKFVVKHPSNEVLRNLSKSELKQKFNGTQVSESIVYNSLHVEICTELEKMRGSPYTNEKFEKIIEQN